MADTDFTPFPTARPGGAPSNDYERVDVSPDTFGAGVGRATEKAGGQLRQAGSEIFQTGMQQMELQNEITANDMNSTATEALGNLYNDYTQLQGANAQAGLADYQKGVKSLVDDALAKAPSLKVKAALSGSLRYMGDRYLNYGVMHAKEQFKTYMHQSAITAADSHANAAMHAFINNDPVGFDASMEAGAQQFMKIGEQQGLDKDSAEALAAKYRGEVVTQAVKLSIDGGDPAKARAILDKYKGSIDTGGLVAAEGALRPIELKVDSGAVVAHSTKPISISQAPLPAIEHSWKGFSAERKAQLLSKGYEAPANPNDPPVIPKISSAVSEKPLSTIPKGAGYDIASASTGDNAVAIKSAWQAHINKGVGGLAPLQDYFANMPKDIQIATARNFEKNLKLWESVPENFTDFLGNKHPIRKPLQEASAKLLKDNPVQIGAGHTAGAPAAPSGGIDELSRRRNAISSIEGNYNSIGPDVKDKVTGAIHNGIGRYQVMSNNVGDWTQQALGHRMTPEEFRADHSAQDKVFDTIFGGYTQQYGLIGAVRKWFTGSPTGRGHDVNISADTYVRRFIAAYTSRAVGSFGESAPSGSYSRASMAMAPKSLAVSRVLAATEGNPALRNASMAELNRQYTDWNTMNAAQQAELRQNVPSMIRDAESGEADLTDLESKFPYNDIRNYMDPDKGEAWIKEFDAAKQVGGMIAAMKWSSPEEMQQAQVDLANGQGPIFDMAAGQSSDPAETYRLASMGSKRLAKELETRQKILVGPEADPAKFVRTNPAVFSAWQQYSAAKDPTSFGKYAATMLTVQKQLGVGEAYAHVFSRDQARSSKEQIVSGATQAKARINDLRQRVGPDAWPYVYRDLVTLGKLPPEYQALNMLEGDDAKTMGLALSESDKDPDKDKGWASRLGHGDLKVGNPKKELIDSAVAGNNNLQRYEESLRQSGISESDINSMSAQVRTLAYGNSYFNKNDNAADAVKAFVGQFDYLAPGGARVPVSVMPTIKQNAATLLNSIDNQILLPEWVGQPNYPSKENYIATVKSGAEWVTAASGDRLYLRKPGSMLANMPPDEKAFGSLSAAANDPWVRGLNGEPVSVMLSGDKPYENFEPPVVAPTREFKTEEPVKTPITDAVAPEPAVNDELLTPQAKEAVQVYENAIAQSGHFTKEEVQAKVNEFKSHLYRPQPMPGGNKNDVPPAPKTPEVFLGVRG